MRRNRREFEQIPGENRPFFRKKKSKNMKSRAKTARKRILFWTLFIGIGAVGGTAMMLFDPTGETTGMTGLILFFQVLPLADRLFQTRSEYHCAAPSLAARRIELKKALALQVLFSCLSCPKKNCVKTVDSS